LNAVSLFALTPSLDQQSRAKGDMYDVKDKPLAWVSVKAFLAMAQKLGKTLFHQGDLSYIEVYPIFFQFQLSGGEHGDSA
jgi:hypothetical protein